MLFLFRKVYAEVGSALPLNGATYTVLLNTTTKRLAAGAAVLTWLSYVATTVISAGEARHYAHNRCSGLPVFAATLLLLGLFTVLDIIGISESAIVALSIFVLHMLTLVVLSISGAIAVIQDPSRQQAHWSLPQPEGVVHALFFGFAAAMLDISGFESSANFIEGQEDRVFPKTLRNIGKLRPTADRRALGPLRGPQELHRHARRSFPPPPQRSGRGPGHPLSPAHRLPDADRPARARVLLPRRRGAGRLTRRAGSPARRRAPQS